MEKLKVWFGASLGLAVVAIVVGFAGCSHDQSPEVDAQRLFIAVDTPPGIWIYRAKAESGTLPLQTIKETPPDEPAGVAVDGSGEVFIANRNGNVRVFGPDRQGHYVLVRSYAGPHTRIQHPSAIAVNMAGSFYIADLGDGHGRVEWFSGGATNDIYPDKVLEGPNTGITSPSGVAIDASGRAFVSNRATNQVLVFDPNASEDARPLVVLEGLHAPGHLAVDDLLNVYVVNTTDNSVAIFESVGPQSWRLKKTLTSQSIKDPSGVAVDAAYQIAIGGIRGVWFFAANADHDARPVRTLGWSSSINPAGLFIQ